MFSFHTHLKILLPPWLAVSLQVEWVQVASSIAVMVSSFHPFTVEGHGLHSLLVASTDVTPGGLAVEQRTHHQITGEPMKFLTLADWTGMVETELFAQTATAWRPSGIRYSKSKRASNHSTTAEGSRCACCARGNRG